MNKFIKFLLIAFICYLVGHILWSFSLFFNGPLFFNEDIERWFFIITFGLFGLFGLLATIELYRQNY